jgi:antirestriction protein ArdC
MSAKPAEIIAARFIESIAKGVAPWVKPWRTQGGCAPRNGITRREYSGFNFFALLMMGYDSPNWFTFKKAAEVGAMVKKGSKGTPIAFWTFLDDKKDPTGKKKIPLLRYYTVFNERQIDNLPEKYTYQPLVIDGNDIGGNAISAAEDCLAKWGEVVPVTFAGSRACYSSAQDTITMPKQKDFNSYDNYYHTFFHVCAHSTGHVSRLNRQLSNPFGSKLYAQEELVAELTAALCGQHFGYDVQGQDAAYLKNWIGALENDAQEIMRAATKAQKAFDMLVGKREQEEQDEE